MQEALLNLKSLIATFNPRNMFNTDECVWPILQVESRQNGCCPSSTEPQKVKIFQICSRLRKILQVQKSLYWCLLELWFTLGRSEKMRVLSMVSIILQILRRK